MAAVRDLIGPEETRRMAEELRKDAEWHREQWRACSAEAGRLENQLTAEERHVRVREPTALLDRPKYETLVIQIAYELRAEFLTADVVEAGVPYPTALKWLKVWEERGALESVTVGNRLMWARTIHVPEAVNRERRETPENRVVRLAPRSATPVAGTGRAQGATDPGVKAMIAQCRAKGAQVNLNGSGHWEVRKDRLKLGTIPNTPSDWRSLPNARADIRRNGLPI